MTQPHFCLSSCWLLLMVYISLHPSLRTQWVRNKMADLGYAIIWETNLALAPMLWKLIWHWHSNICLSGTSASPRQWTGSEMGLSRALGADKKFMGRRQARVYSIPLFCIAIGKKLGGSLSVWGRSFSPPPPVDWTLYWVCYLLQNAEIGSSTLQYWLSSPPFG